MEEQNNYKNIFDRIFRTGELPQVQTVISFETRSLILLTLALIVAVYAALYAFKNIN